MASLIVVISHFIDALTFWPAALLNYAIPPVIALNLAWLTLLCFKNRRLILFPLSIILLGFQSIRSTYQIVSSDLEGENPISVLSFNAKLFRQPGSYGKFSTNMIQWVANDSSDIKCIQEYSTNARWEPLDVTRQIIENGYDQHVFKADLRNSEHSPGLAIFSKYPVVNRGVVWENPYSLNAGIYADIRKGNDTIRIYNVHLASMHLDLSDYKETSNYSHKLKYLLRRMKNGAIQRSKQIKLLLEHTKKTHYPVIICGDFNEIPYSNNYHQLNSTFQNSFESAGTGFGFTLNSRANFLRIDHQFTDEQVDVLNYTVDRSMKISDHFPTRGFYQIRQ